MIAVAVADGQQIGVNCEPSLYSSIFVIYPFRCQQLSCASQSTSLTFTFHFPYITSSDILDFCSIRWTLPQDAQLLL